MYERHASLLAETGADRRRLVVRATAGNAFVDALPVLNGRASDLRAANVDAYIGGVPETPRWFEAASRQIFDVNFGLFQMRLEIPTLYDLSAFGKFQDNYQDLYRGVGRFLAVTILAGERLTGMLPVGLLAELMETDLTIEDLQVQETRLAAELLEIMTRDPQQLAGLRLRIGEVDHVVTAENRKSLVRQKLDSLKAFHPDVHECVQLIKAGFNAVISADVLKRHFPYPEHFLGMLIAGKALIAPTTTTTTTTTTTPDAAAVAPAVDRTASLETRLAAMKREVTGGEVEDPYAMNPRADVDVNRETAFVQSLHFLTGPARRLRVAYNHARFAIRGEPFYNRAAMTEYIDAATKQLFSPEFNVFERSAEEPHYYMLKATAWQNFEPIGRFLALALMSNRAIGVSLPVWFYSKLLGSELALEDIKEDEPALYRSFSYLLTADADGLEDMVIEIHGVEHPVTLANRADLIKRKINSLFPRDVDTRFELVRSAFGEVLPLAVANRYMTAVELKNLFIGATTINAAELADSIEWKADTSPAESVWMRNMLQSFSQEDLHVFLKFATNLPRVPFGGVRTINPRINVSRQFSRPDKFPTVYHCHNMIHLPPYVNEAQFRERFTRAMKDSNWGLK